MDAGGFFIQIAAGAVVIFIAEAMLPEGKIKNTAKFALGLLFMLLVLRPLAGWIGGL